MSPSVPAARNTHYDSAYVSSELTAIDENYYTDSPTTATTISSSSASPYMPVITLETTEFGADLSISAHSEAVIQCAVYDETAYSEQKSPIFATTASIPDLKVAVPSSTCRLHDALAITEFGSELTKLCHSDGGIPAAPCQLLNGRRNYLADIPISDQFMQPVKSPDYLVSMAASAIEMDKAHLKLSTLCHFEGDRAAAKLKRPLIHWMDSSTNQLDIQNTMAFIPQPSMDHVIAFSIFPTLLGPDLVLTPTFSALPEHSHRRGVTISTQPDHQNRQADVQSGTDQH